MKNPKPEEHLTKAAKREKKNRLRMKMHGRSLLKHLKYAGEKLTKRK